MDGSFRVVPATLPEAIDGGIDFDDIRHRVQAWVREYALFPCRTFPTESGVGVNHYNRDGEVVRFFLSLSLAHAKRCLAQYEGGW